ncbi:MAG: glycosyl hydrolase [Flavobacterium sp. MedPE-SWcel]|uniref:glycoside hydrolase family 31 protein n=1 Tax=uncultured Flavobacterium sp. TaxID=165435 RepID=UPI00090F00E8|nr:TIM-barrel domain-containing protein [uncultured Flavobacterium sp.]OIQ17621.1 MAG: glycosyl hydrolase [Flavobacterium sp. MedPE-SWcel]
MKYIYSIIFLFLVTAVTAQNTSRKLQKAQSFDDHLELVMNDGKYIITPYSENIVETSFIPTREKENKESHAVVMHPRDVKAKYKGKKGKITYSTKGIEVVIQESPFTISYYYKNKLLLSEKEGYVKKDSTEAIRFNIDKTEALYGGGARALGMNRRGNRLQLYNRAHYGYGGRSELMNFTMPLVMSSKIYAVHFDNAPIGWLDLDSKKDNTLEYETISGRKTYQVIAADNWYSLTESYTELTGRQPMPARWTLGNFASRFGYHSEKEVRDVVNKFREEKIPLDAVVLDLYWFGKDMKGTMGNLTFLRDSFPTPEGMIASLARRNVKTVLITEPFVLTTSNRWQEAVDNKVLATDENGKPYTYDFYFGNTGIIDVWKPNAKKWFWNIYKDYINRGVAGWWGDLGEPEVHPSYVQHAIGSADEVHNIYGHDWAKLVQEGYKQDFPNQRPFILMRAGYSGSQRYGMIPWSGDVGRSWGGLQSQPEIALQMGMQGIGYMHSDLGGFAGDNIDDELYVRWLQYGVFQPIFRPHAQESVPAEPIFRKPAIKTLAKKAIELRYKMLPYNYTLAFLNSEKGYPLMRPLFFEEPENETLHTLSDEYLWGDAILVAPVLKQGIKERDVYFPKGNNWYSSDNKVYEGGTIHTITIKEEAIPYFYKGGSFVMKAANAMQSTEDYTAKKLEVHYYVDRKAKKSSGLLYEDDGVTADAYGKGMYEILTFKAKVRRGEIAIDVLSEVGRKYKKVERELTFYIHDGDKVNTIPVTIKSGGIEYVDYKILK